LLEILMEIMATEGGTMLSGSRMPTSQAGPVSLRVVAVPGDPPAGRAQVVALLLLLPLRLPVWVVDHLNPA